MQVKNFLSARGVEFEVVDVTADPDAAAKVVELTGMPGVPVTVRGGKVVRGYDPKRLEALLS